MKYKKLIVTGCSYTENLGGWAYQLAAEYNLELINLGCRGAGNKHIFTSLLYYLAKNNVDIETTLIGIMWSHPIREDFIFEKNTKYEDQSIYIYDYDQYNSCVGKGSILQQLDLNDKHVKTEVFKSKLWANDNKSAITLQTWTYVESLISYLQNNNYTFFQTIFLDYLNKSVLINVNSDSKFQKEYSYSNELKRINLKHNKVNWIELAHAEYLGEYAYYTNKLAPNKMHPSAECAEQWAKTILIPKLQAMNILDT